MEDRSLDEFLDAGGEESSDGDAEGDFGDASAGADQSGDVDDATDPDDDSEPEGGERGPGGASESDRGTSAVSADGTAGSLGVAESPSDEVEPAESTYAWDGAGGTCDDCGDTVARRWRQGAALVCGDCKDW